MSPEFKLIHQHFTRPTSHTTLSVGDDAALIRVSEGTELAISADMLVAGTHFFSNCDAYSLGWKSIAVNLSDMAAMGATPKWATLAIALPEINNDWLHAFSKGFFACAKAFDVDLIGGDTTRGPLTISVQIMGEVNFGEAIKRSGAKVGDDIWVSGTLGDAAMALAELQGKLVLPQEASAQCAKALHLPQARVKLGLALSHLATSAIDISDGLLADLGHILEKSNVGAAVDLQRVPHSSFADLRDKNTLHMVLAGGDDYELCFTAQSTEHAKIRRLAQQLKLPISHIGNITPHKELVVLGIDGNALTITEAGFDHFNAIS